MKWIFNSMGSYANLRTSTPGSTSSSAVTYYTYPGDSVFDSDDIHPKKSAYSARCIMNIQVTTVPEINNDMQFKLNLHFQNNLLYISYLAPVQSEDLKFTLYDSKGSLIKELQFKDNRGIFPLDPGDLKSGIYLGKLQLSDGRLLIEKIFIPKR